MEALLKVARRHPLTEWTGRIVGVSATTVEASGPLMRLGDVCRIESDSGGPGLDAEVVGLRPGRVVLMPFGAAQGIGLDDVVRKSDGRASVPVGPGLAGRVIDAFGAPLDGLPPPRCERLAPLRQVAPNPLARPPVDRVMVTGVRCIDAFLSLGRGQRVGIFAGSGVGKSTLLAMLARGVQADINVVALVGERGREVREFIENHLGEEGLRRSVVVVATSDQPAVLRARAALTATAVAEYFSGQGRHVFLMMDSVTRHAMARREIELAAGQPPTARGYTPGVFADIPALCERAGTDPSGGSITAAYTVLVEGDDHNEPVADCLRATLDGHIVLSRELAHAGHFPSIDVLQSVSRLASGLVDPAQAALVGAAREAMATFDRYREMVEMGLYKAGANPDLDAAQVLVQRLTPFLRQAMGDVSEPASTWQALQQALAATGAAR